MDRGRPARSPGSANASRRRLGRCTAYSAVLEEISYPTCRLMPAISDFMFREQNLGPLERTPQCSKFFAPNSRLRGHYHEILRKVPKVDPLRPLARPAWIFT